jgi:putative phosphoribosyl transferase
MRSNSRLIYIPVGRDEMQGWLDVPEKSSALVVLVAGNQRAASSVLHHSLVESLNEIRIATLFIDLLTPDEELVRFQEEIFDVDIDSLASRLTVATRWLSLQSVTHGMHVGYLGEDFGGAVALAAAGKNPNSIEAIVCAGSRPVLPGAVLSRVVAPTLLIVGGNDLVVVELNYQASADLKVDHRLEIIPNSGQIFNQPGIADTVAALARDWFESHLGVAPQRRAA